MSVRDYIEDYAYDEFHRALDNAVWDRLRSHPRFEELVQARRFKALAFMAEGICLGVGEQPKRTPYTKPTARARRESLVRFVDEAFQSQVIESVDLPPDIGQQVDNEGMMILASPASFECRIGKGFHIRKRRDWDSLFKLAKQTPEGARFTKPESLSRTYRLMRKKVGAQDSDADLLLAFLAGIQSKNAEDGL